MSNKYKYIISFDRLPECNYREEDEVITQFSFHKSLIPNTSWLSKGERISINDEMFIIKDMIELLDYIILKCIEDV